MVTLAKINGVSLPPIKSMKPGRRVLADEAQTASGLIRQDVVAIKRTWKINFVRMTKAEYDSIIAVLDSVGWGTVDFWYDELGPETDTVKALITIDDEERIPSSVRGLPWDESARELSITVREQ